MYKIENKRVALYGDIEFESRTGRIKTTLERCGIQVDYIIDRRYANEEKDKKRISFDKFKRLSSIDTKQNWVIVLCFYSLATHMAVANNLHKYGFNQIIFLPGNIATNITRAHTMRSFFNHLIYGDITLEQLLPDYIDIHSLNNRDDGIIAEYGRGKYVSMYVPIDILYIGMPQYCVFGKISDDYLLSMQDKHISEYESHNELFRYVFLGGKWPECYATHFSFGRDPRQVVEDRKSVFLEMMRMTFDDPDYWKDAPIPVMWNSAAGHFNILDGHHRVSFFYNVGAKRVPVVMTREDYIKYVDA